MKSKKFWIAVIVILLGWVVYKTYVDPFIKQTNEIRTITYDKNLSIILGGGGNSGILSGNNAVLVIDTKMAEPSKKLYDLARQIAQTKPIIVVNTHIHPDHISGNWFYKGAKIYAGGNYSRDFWIKQASQNSLPTDWVKDRMEFQIGDETVTLMNMPYNIHTQSDIVVYLKKRKLLFTGDIVLNRQVPALVKKTGVDVNGYLRALEDLPRNFDIQKLVPGHGDIGGIDLIENFKRYFADMKTAADDPSQEKAMKEKYKEWRQVPMVMSNDEVIEFLRDKKNPI